MDVTTAMADVRRPKVPGSKIPPLPSSSPDFANYSDSLRIFFRARFRAKACFTRRFAPGFR
jgi:hypothetical protein